MSVIIQFSHIYSRRTWTSSTNFIHRDRNREAATRTSEKISSPVQRWTADSNRQEIPAIASKVCWLRRSTCKSRRRMITSTSRSTTTIFHGSMSSSEWPPGTPSQKLATSPLNNINNNNNHLHIPLRPANWRCRCQGLLTARMPQEWTRGISRGS